MKTNLKQTLVASLVAAALTSTNASAWSFDYRDGVIVGGVAVLAAGPAALAFPAFLLTGGAATQKYGDYIGWNSREDKSQSPLKQCAAVKDNGITNYNNPNFGKKVVDSRMPLSTELPAIKSQYSVLQRLGAVKAEIERRCTATTDVAYGYAEGGISGNSLQMYCTSDLAKNRGFTYPHLKFKYQILENGRMIRHDNFGHETGCVHVIDDSAMTAKFVADSAPGVLD